MKTIITAIVLTLSLTAFAQEAEEKKTGHDKEHAHVKDAEKDHEHDAEHHKAHDHKAHHPDHKNEPPKKK